MLDDNVALRAQLQDYLRGNHDGVGGTTPISEDVRQLRAAAVRAIVDGEVPPSGVSDDVRDLRSEILRAAARRDAGCAIYFTGIDLDAALLLVEALER